MAGAGFCGVCGQYVWLTEEGGGSCGHAASEISNVYDAQPAEHVVVEQPFVQQTTQAAVEAPAQQRRRVPLVAKILVPIAVIGLVVIAAVAYLFAQPKLVVTAMGVPSSAGEDEEIIVTVDVTNEGLLGGQKEIVVLLDGQDAGSATVDIGGGESERVEIAIQADKTPGRYEVSLADWEGFGGELQIMTPASFEIDITVDPNPLDFSKQKNATVIVVVTNIGESEGMETLDVALDGESLESRDVRVEGGRSERESFSITLDEPGSHQVTVNGVTVDVEAHQISRPANGTVLVNDLGGGSNRLSITNNRTEDVLMVLSKAGEDEPLLAVYVRAGSSHTVRSIKSGTYSYYYSHGDGWCTACKAFTSSVTYGRFEDDSTLSSSGSSYTESKVTFGLTEGEGSPTESMPEQEFPTF
jgi:hypothetical protein